VGGFVGAFFALPVAATIQTFMSNYSKGYAVTDSAMTHVDAPAPAAPKKSRKGWGHHSSDEGTTSSGPPPTAGAPRDDNEEGRS